MLSKFTIIKLSRPFDEDLFLEEITQLKPQTPQGEEKVFWWADGLDPMSPASTDTSVRANITDVSLAIAEKKLDGAELKRRVNHHVKHMKSQGVVLSRKDKAEFQADLKSEMLKDAPVVKKFLRAVFFRGSDLGYVEASTDKQADEVCLRCPFRPYPLRIQDILDPSVFKGLAPWQHVRTAEPCVELYSEFLTYLLYESDHGRSGVLLECPFTFAHPDDSPSAPVVKVEHEEKAREIGVALNRGKRLVAAQVTRVNQQGNPDKFTLKGNLFSIQGWKPGLELEGEFDPIIRADSHHEYARDFLENQWIPQIREYVEYKRTACMRDVGEWVKSSG